MSIAFSIFKTNIAPTQDYFSYLIDIHKSKPTTYSLLYIFLGKTPAEWLRGSLLRALASHKQAKMPMNSPAVLKIVYPSVDNVMTGYFGHESGGCLPYSKTTNEKQKWLQQHMQ